MPYITYTNFQIDVHGANPNSWSYNPTVQSATKKKKKKKKGTHGLDDGDVSAETFFDWLDQMDSTPWQTKSGAASSALSLFILREADW